MRQFLKSAFRRDAESAQTEDGSVRGLPLMAGEQVQERFAANHGLVSGAPKKGPLLLITNLRVISFLRGEDVKETYLAPIDELKTVFVKGKSRGVRNLIQGILFVLAGILAYFIIGYIRESTWSEISIASVVGLIVVVFGASYLARHLLWEPEGEIVFQGGTWEKPSANNRGAVESYQWQMSFPYRSDKANDEVYTLVNRFFEIRSLNGYAVDVELTPDTQAIASGGLEDRTAGLPPSDDGETLVSQEAEIWRLYVHGPPTGPKEEAAPDTAEATQTYPPWRRYTYGSE